MAPKKRTKADAGSSSNQGYNTRIFANDRAYERYQRLNTKVVIQDRGMECDDKQYRHDPIFDEIWRNVITRGWQQFVTVTTESNTSLSLEFLAN